MIVTCTSCKTRLRVSEDKIGPKGARIRCSRCKAVFVVCAGPAAGGVDSDPPDAPRWPDLEQPPPLPGARGPSAGAERNALPDPFELAPSSSPPAPAPDPFAAAQPAFGGASPGEASPAASGPPPVPAASDDPFALPGASAPASSEDPFGGGLGWDPFGVAEAAAGGGREEGPPFPGHPTTNVTELLEEREAPAPVDLGSLTLEEREAPPSRASAPASYAGTDLDLGLGMPDVLGAPASDGFAPPGPPPTSSQGPVDAESPRARDSTPLLGGEEASAVPGPAAPVAPPPSEAEAQPTPAAAPARGRVAVVMANSFSLALLIALAGALFFTWRSGLVGRVRGALARGAPSALEASGVTGGLYDTATGAPVLVVRGRIGARGAVAGPVRVRVQLLDGGRVVASAAGLAGAAATADQVYGAGTVEEAAALRSALDAAAATRLAAGDSVPFLVVFPAPAPDPRGLALRVDAEPAAATSPRGG